MSTDKTQNSTIVNVRFIGENMTLEELVEMFSPYGTMTSCKIMVSNDIEVGRFAYVAFEDPDAAEEAIIELNGQKTQDGGRMLLRRTCEKIVRQRERKTAEKENTGKIVKKDRKLQNGDDIANRGEIFVHQLGKEIDGEYLRNIFREYGAIVWARVIMDKDGSKGYGFVKFSRPEDAIEAVREMHGWAGNKDGRPWRVELARGTNRFGSPHRDGFFMGLDRDRYRGRSLQRDGFHTGLDRSWNRDGSRQRDGFRMGLNPGTSRDGSLQRRGIGFGRTYLDTYHRTRPTLRLTQRPLLRQQGIEQVRESLAQTLDVRKNAQDKSQGSD